MGRGRPEQICQQKDEHIDSGVRGSMYMNTRFFIRKYFVRKWASIPQNLKRMFRKTLASTSWRQLALTSWAAAFKNDFPRGL